MSTAERDASGLPAGLVLAWGGQRAASRGPKPGLTLDQIVATAVRLADEGGLAAVSMSKVAKALGFTAMSLYRYLRTKDDLVLLMSDAVMSDPPEPVPGEACRAGCERWTRAVLDVYRLHPWTLDVPITGPPAAPNELLWLDRLLQVLGESNLTDQDKLSTSLVLSGHVRGWAQLSRGLVEGRAGMLETPMDGPSYSETLSGFLDPVAYPALAPLVAAGELDDDGEEDDLDEIFDFGLERILDGIDDFIAAQS